VNKTGGIIAGRDVNLTTLRGDLINKRTVTSHQSASGDLKDRHDFLDSAARIEAANDLTLNAGRDLNNTGGVLQAKRGECPSAVGWSSGKLLMTKHRRYLWERACSR
jgi:filamentous hemagglutinin